MGWEMKKAATECGENAEMVATCANAASIDAEAGRAGWSEDAMEWTGQT